MPILAQLDGQPHRVYMQVRPVLQGRDPTRHALVLFIEGETIDKATEAISETRDGRPATDQAIRQLQEELQLAQNQLRVTR